MHFIPFFSLGFYCGKTCNGEPHRTCNNLTKYCKIHYQKSADTENEK